MVVAVVPMGMVKPSLHQVIKMVAVRHGFVPTTRPMLMRAAALRGALRRVAGANWEDVLVDMIPMHVVQMSIVQIINVAFMSNGRVPAVGTMFMRMVGMVLLGAGAHGNVLFLAAGTRKIEAAPRERGLGFDGLESI
jgi:hypothetical protein